MAFVAYPVPLRLQTKFHQQVENTKETREIIRIGNNEMLFDLPGPDRPKGDHDLGVSP